MGFYLNLVSRLPNNSLNATVVAMQAPAEVVPHQNVEEPETGGVQQQHVQFAEVAMTELSKLEPTSVPIDTMYEETVRSFLKRPYPVFSGTWTSDQSRGEELFTFSAVEQYLLATTRIRDKMTGFQYLRGGMRFTIRMNGTRFHYGAIVVAFYPMDEYIGPQGQSRRNAISATMMPSVMVNPHQDEVATLEVPYAYPYNYLDLTFNHLHMLGDLRGYVLVPLQAVNQTTVGRVPYTVYAQFVDPVVTGFTSRAFAIEPGTHFLVEQAQVGDKATRVVPEFLNLYSTDENDTAVSAGVVGYPTPNPASLELGFKTSDMEFSEIFTRANPWLFMSWASEYAAGFTISRREVSPNTKFLGHFWDSGNPNSYQTYLQILSKVHHFWRGGLRFKVQVIASAFHTGRLMVSWNPRFHSVLDTPLNDRANENHIILDVQQTTELFFEVPHMHMLPWLLTDSPGTQPGSLAFTVLNSLSTPSGEPTNVDILVWMYGSSTLQFAAPKTQTNPTASPVVLQEQCLAAPLNDPRFGSISGAHDTPEDACMGEKITSVHQVLSKMALLVSISSTSNEDGAQASVFQTMPNNFPASHFEVLKRMYLLSRGPVKYATVMATVTDPTTLNYNAPVYAAFDITTQVAPGTLSSLYGSTYPAPPFGSLLVKPDSAPNSAIVVPYYCAALFLLNHAGVRSPDLDPAPVFQSRQYSIGLGITLHNIYASAAPGYQLGYLIAPLSPPPYI